MEANWRSSPTSTTLAPARSACPSRGASLRVPTMAASSTTSTVRPSSSVRPRLEVEQQPVDRAGVGEAFVGQPDGGDPGRGGAEDLVAVQLERLPGQPQRPGLARPGPPDHHRHPGAALGEVADHGRLVLPGGGVAVQDLADNLRPDDGAALAGPAGGAVDQLPLKCQQLRRREPVHPQAPVVADPDGPLGQEPVGRRPRPE